MQTYCCLSNLDLVTNLQNTINLFKQESLIELLCFKEKKKKLLKNALSICKLEFARNVHAASRTKKKTGT